MERSIKEQVGAATWESWPVGARMAIADAQATIAALQARVRTATQLIIAEIGASGPEDLEEAVGRIVGRLQQRTAERDCARRRVDELEAREVDVVLLREDLEKRTAECEALQVDNRTYINERHENMKQIEQLQADLAQRTAELERVRDQFADLRKMVAALPKVEGEIEIYTGKNTNQVVVTYKRGVIIGTLYGLDHAKPVAALYEHRQGMEG